jgi:hypothetical protein
VRASVFAFAVLLLPVAARAELEGRIAFVGPVPKPAAVDMSSDPYCRHAAPHARAQDLRVSDGGVEDVFVYLKAPPARVYPQPLGAVRLTLSACAATPRVVAVRVGQRLLLSSADETFHALRIQGAEREVGRRLPKAGASFEHRFTQPQVMARLRCDVHPWMQAYVAAVAHPYFAVSGPGGAVRVPTADLPDGRYEVGLWHETLGEKHVIVEVRGGQGRLDAELALPAPSP